MTPDDFGIVDITRARVVLYIFLKFLPSMFLILVGCVQVRRDGHSSEKEDFGSLYNMTSFNIALLFITEIGEDSISCMRM